MSKMIDQTWKEMYKAAKEVQNSCKISNHMEAGGIAATVLSASNRIYVGVCVDTACMLGICAERDALFNMIANGEKEIKRVLTIMPNGKNGAPCGACREFMVQLMEKNYRNIEIMMDYEHGKVVTLGELTPNWWL